MYQYEFSEENKEYLLRFLLTAKTAGTNKFCNNADNQKFAKFIHKADLQNDFNCLNKNNSVIDLTESDDDNSVNLTQNCLLHAVSTDVQIINHPARDDILHLIKENLQIDKCLSSSTIVNLHKSELDHAEIFYLLSEKLNAEEVLNFGYSLKPTVCSNSVVSYYIRYILIKKLVLEYSDEFQILLCEFSKLHSDILLEEIIQTVIEEAYCSRVFLQFIDGLCLDFKQKLLSKFIITCETLHEHYIPLLDTLITNDTEYDILSKLSEILSRSEHLNTDKSFGKLLMRLIKLLGKNIVLLEKPLKHVIGSHKSIWKTKLQKIFDDCLQESSVLSQSVRY